MKSEKNIYVAILILMLSLVISMLSYATEQDDDITAVISEQQGGTISGHVVLPEGMTKIPDGAFYNCVDLLSVKLPSTLTEISAGAFYGCTSLTGIEIPPSVRIIKTQAFYGCSSLTNIVIPDSVTRIDAEAFKNCAGLKSVSLSKNLSGVSKEVFYGCTNLESIILPENTTSISVGAFYGCSKLAEVKWPENLTAIQESAFNGCINLKDIPLSKNLELIGKGAFYNCYSLTNVNITGNQVQLFPYAFFGCKGLINVSVGEGVARIGQYAFAQCVGLKSITLENGVKTIDEYAFSDCVGLTYIVIPESVATVKNGAFSNCSNLNAVNITDIKSWCETDFVGEKSNPLFYARKLYHKDVLVQTLNIPKEVLVIKGKVFEYCTSIVSVTIPDSVKEIHSFAFSNCINLNDVNLGNGIVKISAGSFVNCVSLRDITIPDSVSEIEYYSFGGCTGLAEIILPNGLKTIGNSVFENCTALTEITLPNSVTRIGYNVFVNCENLKKIVIPDNALCDEGLVFHGCKNLTSVHLGNSITTIGKWAFKDCAALTNVTIGINLHEIGYGAFENCKQLSTIILPDTVRIIDDYAFCNCERLCEFDMPENVIKIGDYAFYNCDIIGDIVIPNGVSRIGNKAFYNCHLKNVDIPDSVTEIGDSAFWNCSLETISIPGSVQSIGDYAFERCTKLSKLKIYNGVETIGTAAFRRCESLLDITLPDSIKVIGDAAFATCLRLSRVTLPKSLERLGNAAFNSCYSLEEIDIPSGISTIEDTTFRMCFDLKHVSIPNGVTGIGISAFEYCHELVSVSLPNSVKYIKRGAFHDCENLVNITIHSNMEIIEDAAFDECIKLKNVFFEGTPSAWKSIVIGENNYCLTNAQIDYGYNGTEDFVYDNPIHISNGSFNFASGKGSANFQYDDNYFQNSSYTYNHDLAKMSMRLALSAYGKNITIAEATDNSCEAKDYSKAYINAENLLEKLGFVSNEDTQGAIAHNEWYENKPEQNSIGVIVGRKHIKYPNYNCTLIAVAIRGGGYEAEWGGNFNVGTGEYHAGFELARNQVIDFIKKYIKEQGISGNIKLWITGYSRAGATANLTAAYLDENPEALGSNVKLYNDDIYAYCFEPPMGIKNPDNESGLYNNIFSIVNEHDFVPMVAMRQWGFDRYGITKYLPTPSSTYRYFNLEADMEEELKKYLNERYIVDDFKFEYILSSWARGKDVGMQNMQGFFLDKIIYILADAVKNPTYYEENFQNVIMEIMKNPSINSGDFGPILRNIEKKLTERKVLIYAESALVTMNPSLYGWTLYTTVRASVKDAFNASGIPVTNKTIDTITEFISSVGIENFYNLVKNIDGIKQGHRPELCMAWLDVIDEDDFSNQRYRSIYLNCPVDLEVYDSNDNLVAAFYNDVPQKIEGSSIIAYLDENGQKVIILPTDEEFRTEIIATDDGEVTYSVQEQNSDTGEIRVINYNKMSMKKSDTLTGIAENLETTEVALYSLVSDSVEVSEAEFIEDAEPIKVEINATGNGIVSNGGEYYKGEFVEAVATPAENEEFSGWYNGDTIVSTDTAYRFQVTEEITLTAMFTENTCEILYLTDDEDVVAIDRILKGTKVTFPSMTQNPNYMILDIYTDAEHTTLADKNTIYSEDTMLYAKVLTKDEWVQFDEVNNKVVVYSSVATSGIQLMMALYEGEKLTELKPNTVGLVVGKNEFDNPITNTGTADTLKIFVWNGLSTLKPLFKNCIVDLK